MTVSKLINYTTREFISDNELELYVSKQDEIFTPDVIKEFSKAGMLRRVLTRIWNKEGVARVGILFEYRDEKAFVDWEVKGDNNIQTIQFSRNDMERMKANPGDLVYLCDKRGWLGGLKSIHATYGDPHDRDGIVIITNEQQQSGLFDQGRKLFGAKEM